MIAKRIWAAIGICVVASFTGCRVEEELAAFSGGDVSVPTMVSVRAVSETEVEARFGDEVRLVDARFSPANGGEVIPVSVAPVGRGDDGLWAVRFPLGRQTQLGVPYLLEGTVEDSRGNTLSFAVPVTAFNGRVPRLIMNEARFAYASPRVEFIELLALTSGNLAGVRLENAGNEDLSAYEFPAAEVAAGDFIVLHYRTVEEGIVDETEKVDVSAGTDALPTARDFWIRCERAPLPKTNVLLLVERAGGAILDALCVRDKELASWPTEALAQAASRAVVEGAWGPDGSPASSVSLEGASPTRTLGREPGAVDTNEAVDWALCPTKKHSPGSPNAAREAARSAARSAAR
jgi:hypothetical protein